MSPRLKRILKWVGYPLFYLFALLAFTYLLFPTDRLKNAVEAEFNARQAGEDEPLRLSIRELDTYLLSGAQAQDVVILGPVPDADEDGKRKPRERFVIDEVTARASLLGLLGGTLEVAFDAEAFGGTIEGNTSDADETRSIYVELAEVDVQRAPFVRGAIGAPVGGTLSGTIDLKLPESKVAEAEGTIDLTISDFTVGDGKTKIRDAIALPKVNAGTLVLKAKVAEGRLTIDKFGCKGPDLEVVGDGKLRLRDPVSSSLAEMSLRFKFSDKYRNKSDMTQALLGKPGSKTPGVLDLDPKVKRAKRADGFYAWRLTGPLQKLKFNPSRGTAARSSSRIKRNFVRKKATTKK